MKPPRTQPKIYLLQLKTHKLSVHLTVLPNATLAQVKQEAFEALTSDVVDPLTRFSGGQRDEDDMEEDHDKFNITYDMGLPTSQEDVVPRVSALEDFELCRAIKEKGKFTGKFETIDASEDVRVKESGITGWEVLFVQFRDRETGESALVRHFQALPEVLVEIIDGLLCIPSLCNIFNGPSIWRSLCAGEFLPVKYTLPPLDDDDDEGAPQEGEPSSASLGKRKARADD